MSLMASFFAVLFPRVVLDEIWDLIESVSEGFLYYSYNVSDLIPAVRQCDLYFVV